MFMEFLIKILPLIMEALGTLVIGWAFKIAIPWLKEQRAFSAARKFVKAAHKLAQTGVIPKANKKNYVLNMMQSCGIKVTPVVDAFVEAAVLELDHLCDEIIGTIIEDDGDEEDGETDR